ncbi:MAG: hypothetical protein H6721_00530 [Sandaracinus sp.]|nr:hypothetical protein [Sandaracinus sp.]MCB9618518.1 hypothetical protein [Sandaracinus sp.]MCB9622080.1 hypothetical protein [Sandaracinus sp.]MCB9630629.1 hypothetical protein [Sandaracinus sp.]
MDACVGAVCPRGEVCEAGACVTPEPPPPSDGGVTPRDGGTGADAGDGGGIADEDAGEGSGSGGSGGCGCRSGGDTGGLWLGVALWLVASRRRRD